MISNIRKSGNFEHNRKSVHSTAKLIVSRRPQQFKNRREAHYSCCPRCKGYYSKLTIRRHYITCVPDAQAGERCTLVQGRRVIADVHNRASTGLREKVLPALRQDQITNVIRYDTLAILYGNNLCTKYRNLHDPKMIRAKLRLVGRFIIEMKSLDSRVTDFASIYQVKFADNVCIAIQKLASIDSLGKMNTPSTGADAGTMIKKCGKLLIREYIVLEKDKEMKEVEKFLSLFELDYTTTISNLVVESKLRFQRRKIITVPTIDDVIKLKEYVQTLQKENYDKLLIKFSYEAWITLASATLIGTQIFNRKRAGEIERLEIEDYNAIQSVDASTNQAIFKTLSKDDQNLCKLYKRIPLRGKKGRPVAIIIGPDLCSYLETILKFREDANVHSSNPFVFGLPGSMDYKFISAGKCMHKYAGLCGAVEPESLTGTLLRKHIATHAIMQKLTDTDVADLANFLGHSDKIHKEIYRVPIVAREITTITKFLLAAQGDDEEDINVELAKYADKNLHNMPSTSRDYRTPSPNLSLNTGNNILFKFIYQLVIFVF